MRADAARNRAKVLAAADALFARHGVDAGVPEIAARAGVGKGTVYRAFPTKEHLVAAVAIGRLEAWTERARAAAGAEDALAALRDVLRDSARRQATDRVLADALATAAHVPELQRARAQAVAAFDALVAAVGGAVTGEEVRTLYTGACRALAERGERDPEVWARYADLVTDAVRATTGAGTVASG